MSETVLQLFLFCIFTPQVAQSQQLSFFCLFAFIFFLQKKIIYLAASGLHSGMWDLCCGAWAPLQVQREGSRGRGLCSCGTWD